VIRVTHEHNFENCVNGWDECQIGGLTSQERAEVTAAAHDRLLQSCLAGVGECDLRQLNPSEQKLVAKAAPTIAISRIANMEWWLAIAVN
jgi:hypothetical protein